MKPYLKLLIALVLGAAAGLAAHAVQRPDLVATLNQWIFEPTGQIFLRLIFMSVVPLVFCGLCLGVFDLSRHHGLGLTARRTLTYTLITSALSVVIGVTMANVFRPGQGLSIPAELQDKAGVEKIKGYVEQGQTFTQTLVQLIPTNPVAAAARAFEGEMIALMFFALVFGIALASLRGGQERSPVVPVLEDVFEASLQIVHFAMKLAPLAVFALVFTSVSKFGTKLLISLSYFVAVVVGSLLIQQLVVYSALLKAHGYSPVWFLKQCREVFLYAFATASSNATLPLAIETAEEKLQLPSETSRFVLTVGSTANQNGTALFEGVTVLFLAQVYGVDLTLGQQIQAVLMSILAGVGTAGVPGGSLPLIMILLQQLGIPAEGIGLILGVDRFLDMCRTTINVSGDLVIAALVGRDGET